MLSQPALERRMGLARSFLEERLTHKKGTVSQSGPRPSHNGCGDELVPLVRVQDDPIEVYAGVAFLTGTTVDELRDALEAVLARCLASRDGGRPGGLAMGLLPRVVAGVVRGSSANDSSEESPNARRECARTLGWPTAKWQS